MAGWHFAVDPCTRRALGAIEHAQNERNQDKMALVKSVLSMKGAREAPCLVARCRRRPPHCFLPLRLLLQRAAGTKGRERIYTSGLEHRRRCSAQFNCAQLISCLSLLCKFLHPLLVGICTAQKDTKVMALPCSARDLSLLLCASSLRTSQDH